MVEVGARLGYGKASVERVIEGTEIARSTFYEHFADKDDCFLAALDSLCERLLRKVEATAGAATDNKAIEAVLKAMLGFAEDDQAGATLLFVESLAGGRRSLDLRENLKGKVEAIVEGAWAQERRGGEIVDVPATMLIGGLFRLLAMRLRQREAGLGGLGGELLGWVDSYKIAAGPPRWREARKHGTFQRLSAESLPSLDVPLPLSGGRHDLSSAEVARSQRLRILSAVAQCSYEQGYAAVRVADITSAARVSRKAFYGQFRDKQHAVTEANERVFQAAMSAAAAAFFAVPEWPERIWAGGMALLSFLAIYPEDSYLSFVEPHAIGATTVQHAYDRLAAFSLFLEEGYHYRPEAEGLPKTSSDALIAVMFELGFAELREQRSSEGLLGLLPQLAYTILAPFMGPKGAGEFVEGKVGRGLR
jgi:AcrR family transcriptional regulator